MASGTAPEFKTLKECLEFLYWLKDDKQGKDLQTLVAYRLVKLLEKRYEGVHQRQIADELSKFLYHVSKFHKTLCKSPQGSYNGHKSAKHVTNALLKCVPKLLSSIYFLRYKVDDGFEALGGGGWAKQQVGEVATYARFATLGTQSNALLTSNATKIDKYLIAEKDSKHYGVIPGGFKPSELQMPHQGGYSEGSLMAGDLKNILEKYSERQEIQNYFLDIYSTTVLSNSGFETANVANALRLVHDFCRIFENVEVTDFQNHLYMKDRCIKLEELKNHCAKLKEPLGELFNKKSFSFTGYAREYHKLKTQEIAKKMASWFKKHLLDVNKKLQNMKPFSSLKTFNGKTTRGRKALPQDAHTELDKYFTENFIVYGFTFYHHDYKKNTPPYNVLKTDWDRVIAMLNTKGDGLEELATILNGTLCQQNADVIDEEAEEEPPDVELVGDKFVQVPKKVELPPAKVPEVPKEVVPDKQADGSPNQGKKAEGAQNQGKKTEGNQDQVGGPSETNSPGSPVAKAEQIMSSSVPDSDPGAPGSGSGHDRGGQSDSANAAPHGDQGTPKSQVADTTTSPAPGAGSGGGGDGDGGSEEKRSTRSQVPDDVKKPKCPDGQWNVAWDGKTQMCRNITTTSRHPQVFGRKPPDVLWEEAKKREAVTRELQQTDDVATTVLYKHPGKPTYSYVGPIIADKQSRNTKGDPHALVNLIQPPPAVTVEGKALPNDTKPIGGKQWEDEKFKMLVQRGNILHGSAIKQPPNQSHTSRPLKHPKQSQPLPATSPKNYSTMTPSVMQGAPVVQVPQRTPKEIHKPPPVEVLDGHTFAFQQQLNGTDMTNASITDELVTLFENITPPLPPALVSGNKIPDPKRNAPLPPPPTLKARAKKSNVPSKFAVTVPVDDQVIGKMLNVSGTDLTKPHEKDLNGCEYEGIDPPVPRSVFGGSPIPDPNLKSSPNPTAMFLPEPHPTLGMDVLRPYVLRDNPDFFDLQIDVPKLTLPDNDLDFNLDFDDDSTHIKDGSLPNPIAPSTHAISLDLPPPNIEQSLPPRKDFDPNVIKPPTVQMCISSWSAQTPTHDSTDIPETELFPAESPRTVRDMLQWLAGLKNEKHHETLKQCINKAFGVLQDDPSQLALSVNGSYVRPTDVIDILQLTAMFAGSVLNSIAPNWKANVPSRTAKPKLSTQSDEPDCCALLCQLRDYVYACHHQLEFLKAQCKRDKLTGGWQDCYYGSDTKTPSPLQAFLTDDWDSDFKTHFFDPCNLCHKSRVRMGFKQGDLPKTSQQGAVISTILTPSCGGSDPLLTLASYLSCLTKLHVHCHQHGASHHSLHLRNLLLCDRL